MLNISKWSKAILNKKLEFIWIHKGSFSYSRSFFSRPLLWPFRYRIISGRSLSTTVHGLTSPTVHRSSYTVQSFFKFFWKNFPKKYKFFKFLFNEMVGLLQLDLLKILLWESSLSPFYLVSCVLFIKMPSR